MKQHKWHKEIKHLADGGEIEYRTKLGKDIWSDWSVWDEDYFPEFNNDIADEEYRIKPQPKEPNIECNCYGDGNVYRGTRSSDSTIKTYTYPQDWLNKNPITQLKEPRYLYVYIGENNGYIFSMFHPSKYSNPECIGKIKLEEDKETI